MKPVQTPEEIFDVAFAFMASKALFAGVQLGVFDALVDGPASEASVARKTAADERGLSTLLTALTALGLIELEQDPGESGAERHFRNAPATQEMLVSRPEGSFADYCRSQMDRQMYPFLHNIADVLRGRRDTVPFENYERWFENDAEAALYSESQHSASLPAAALLDAVVDLSGRKRLLDIGGGSGAFSITLCRSHPGLEATIIDFPNVVEVGRRLVAGENLASRIGFVSGNALDVEWPSGQDVVLFSYVSGSVSADGVAEFYRRAYAALEPGGLVLVHDFMVDDDRSGPRLPALWALQHAAFTPDAIGLTPGFVTGLLEQAGFEEIDVQAFIPGMTRLARGTKPAAGV